MTSRRTVSTDFLTVRELAALLRVKPRKVYRLAASSEILQPSDRKAAVSARRYRGVARTARCRALGVERSSKRPPIIVGSPTRCSIGRCASPAAASPRFSTGASTGWIGFVAARPSRLDPPHRDRAGRWNRRHVQDAIGNQPIVLLEWAWRDRGLLVGAGNPLDIDGIQALRGHRFIPRQPGAGSQVLLEKLPPGTRAVHGRARLSGAHCPQRGRGCGERARRQGGRGLRSRVSPGSFTLISCRSRASAMTSRCGGGLLRACLPATSRSGAVPSSHGGQASSAAMISVPPVPTCISTAPEPARRKCPEPVAANEPSPGYNALRALGKNTCSPPTRKSAMAAWPSGPISQSMNACPS